MLAIWIVFFRGNRPIVDLLSGILVRQVPPPSLFDQLFYKHAIVALFYECIKIRSIINDLNIICLVDDRGEFFSYNVKFSTFLFLFFYNFNHLICRLDILLRLKFLFYFFRYRWVWCLFLFCVLILFRIIVVLELLNFCCVIPDKAGFLLFIQL